MTQRGNLRDVTVIGLGRAGLGTAACLANLGHRVVAFDRDAAKIRRLRDGGAPLAERIGFANAWPRAMRDAEIAFICEPTAPDAAGETGQHYIEAAARSAVQYGRRPLILVLRGATMPLGIVERIARITARSERRGAEARLVVNPDLPQDGRAAADRLKPDRIVLGAWSADAAESIAALFAQLDVPVVLTDPHSALLSAYAASAFLETKHSFINEIAPIAERAGASVHAVAAAMGLGAPFDRGW